MMPDQSMQQPPEQQDAAPEQAQGGYEVCLRVSADNSMSVSVEQLAEEGAEMGETEAAGTPVKGLKAAMEMIIGIVQRGGQMDSTAGDEDFAAGFGGDPNTDNSARFG